MIRVVVISLTISAYFAELHSAFGNGDCLGDRNDTGAGYIRQLREAIDNHSFFDRKLVRAGNIRQLREAIDCAACQLVKDTTYLDYSPTEGEQFDFIVVGAGSAGSVVASRLSEKRKWRVLLLEAGGEPTIGSEIPTLQAKEPELLWPYQTQPEPTSCQGNVNKTCSYIKGKVLGGSSTVNGMLYVRGNPKDYDGWEAMGNPGWGYKDMLRYFKKSEDMNSKLILSNPGALRYHSTGGLLKIDLFNDEMENLTNVVKKGFSQLGYPLYSDINAQFQEGTFLFEATLQNSRRYSTAKAFLLHFQTRPNLKISINSLVVKILIDKNKKAVGVKFIKDGRTTLVKASKEVILSAGVVNSPQLLMLSGIGPQKDLEKLRIKVVQNLRVGYNLQDHVQFGGFKVSINPSITFPTEDIVDSTFRFLVNCNGPLTDVGLSFNGLMRSKNAKYTNFQYACYFAAASNLSQFSGSSEDIQLLNENIGQTPTLSLVPVLTRPKSRGRIVLNTTNPRDFPLIYPRFLTIEEDVEDILDSIEFLSKVVKTKAFQSIGARMIKVKVPECLAFEFPTKPYWRCLLRYFSSAFLHAVGTCKMGPRGRADSVVDPSLRVIGVENLRVVDASIMPTVPSGNTNAPAIAIGEKASEMIYQRFGVRYKTIRK